MTVTLVTGASSGIGEATALTLCTARPHGLRLHAYARCFRQRAPAGRGRGAPGSGAHRAGCRRLHVGGLRGWRRHGTFRPDRRSREQCRRPEAHERRGGFPRGGQGRLRDQRLRTAPHDAGRASGDEGAGKWHYREHLVRRGTPRECRPWDLRRDQVRPGGFERGGCHRNEAARDPRHRDRAGVHLDADPRQGYCDRGGRRTVRSSSEKDAGAVQERSRRR